MSDIINNDNLNFLKFNNGMTIYKTICKDMLISKNEIIINFDSLKLPNDNIISLYWKFHNFNYKISGMEVIINNNTLRMREPNYFTLLQPYQHLPNMINTGDEEHDYIYMYSFAIFSSNIFNYNPYAKINKLSFHILTNDDILINELSTFELVVQTELNPNNLPEDLEILKIDSFDFIFENLPVNLKKIVLSKSYDEINLIKKCFPKIPFGCKIVDLFDNEIILSNN